MFSLTPMWATISIKLKKESIRLGDDGIHVLTKEGVHMRPHWIGIDSNGYYAHRHQLLWWSGMPIYEAHIYVDKDKIEFADDAIHINIGEDHVRAHFLSYDQKGYYVGIFPTGAVVK